jgi:hypothetical protein
MASLFLPGCSKSEDDLTVNPNENQLKSAITASPIAAWGSSAVWDDNAGVLKTALWYPPALGVLPNFSFAQFPLYDFSPYYLNGEKEYNPANYDVMAHFGYISPEVVKGAVVQFTFRHIKYFLPHMNNANQQRIYTVNNEDNEDIDGNEGKKDKKGKEGKEDNDDNKTVITCTTDLVVGMNPMFCFLVKVDCGKGNSGCGKEESGNGKGKGKSSYTTFWTDMKVNGVSVKGTIKNKVFTCN